MDPVTRVPAAATAAEVLTPSGAESDVVFAARLPGHLGFPKFHRTLTRSFVGAVARGGAGGRSLVT